MIEINLPPFYVGQKVVACHDKTSIKVPDGSIWTVLNIKQHGCGCWDIDIGVQSQCTHSYCSVHGERYRFPNDYIHWISVKFFAPILENFQSISLEKVLETETKLISVN